ncbi:hypothetical protein VUR80DRAFT_425 [Thermomyces stellatus]
MGELDQEDESNGHCVTARTKAQFVVATHPGGFCVAAPSAALFRFEASSDRRNREFDLHTPSVPAEQSLARPRRSNRSTPLVH